MLKIATLLICSVVIIAGGAAAIYLLLSPLNRSALNQEAGYITSGGKFGINIGSRVGLVSNAVASSGFVFYKRSEENSCLTHQYKDLNVDVYTDDSWRKGTLCVAFRSSDNVVVAMEWAYGPFKIEL